MISLHVKLSILTLKDWQQSTIHRRHIAWNKKNIHRLRLLKLIPLIQISKMTEEIEAHVLKKYEIIQKLGKGAYGKVC